MSESRETEHGTPGEDDSEGQVSELAGRGPTSDDEPGLADEVPPAEDARTEPGGRPHEYGS